MGTDGGTASVRWIAVLSGFAPLAEPAFAGAWTQPANTSQAITTVSREENAFGETWRTDGLGEYGLGGGWGFNLKIENENRSFGDDSRTGYRAGVQKSFALGDRASFSVIATYLGGESMDGPDCVSEGYETRAAVGTSYPIFGREAFVNAEVGWKSRGSDCEREVYEITAGVEVAPRVSVIVKAWSEDGEFGQSAKTESTLLYDLDDKLAVGIGWREEVSGDFEEKGWVVSAWRNF